MMITLVRHITADIQPAVYDLILYEELWEWHVHFIVKVQFKNVEFESNLKYKFNLVHADSFCNLHCAVCLLSNFGVKLHAISLSHLVRLFGVGWAVAGLGSFLFPFLSFLVSLTSSFLKCLHLHNAPPPTRALTHSLPSVFSYPEYPNNPPPTEPDTRHEPHNPGVAIGGAVGGVALLGVAAVLLFVFLRRRQRTFKGDYSTKKHVFGNGYSKAGGIPTHPPIPKNLQYPDDSDDEKKPTQTGGFETSDRDFDTEGEDMKRPYFTVDEGESRDYDERTLGFQYDPEPEIADDMISQTDGSVISKKEWYV